MQRLKKEIETLKREVNYLKSLPKAADVRAHLQEINEDVETLRLMTFERLEKRFEQKNDLYEKLLNIINKIDNMHKDYYEYNNPEAIGKGPFDDFFKLFQELIREFREIIDEEKKTLEELYEEADDKWRKWFKGHVRRTIRF